MDVDSHEPRSNPESELKKANSTPGFRAKTSLRLKYEAESQMILKKFGGLRGIQKSLGLSQRKVCQSLMVDPSSWSRWLVDETKTPPHILRACEWLLAINDKYPGFDVNFWLHSNGKHNGMILEKTQNIHEDLRTESALLKEQVSKLETQILKLEAGIHSLSRKSPNLKKVLILRRALFGIIFTSILFFLLKHFIFR